MTSYVIVDHKGRQAGEYTVPEDNGEGNMYNPTSLLPPSSIGWSNRGRETALALAITAHELKVGTESPE